MRYLVILWVLLLVFIANALGEIATGAYLIGTVVIVVAAFSNKK